MSELRMHAHTKHVWQSHPNGKMFHCVWSNAWLHSNFIEHDSTCSNMVFKWENVQSKTMFVHQTMFEGVWLPNIYCLDRG